MSANEDIIRHYITLLLFINIQTSQHMSWL